LVCLVFPAYYIGVTREPQESLALLFTGWFGPLDGHFAWFANLFYVLALISYRKPKLSAIFGFFALALALSFLGYEQVITSEVPTYKKIVAYGYGYFLWVVAIGLMAIAQLLAACFQEPSIEGSILKVASFVIWIVGCTSAFAHHFYYQSNSQNSFEQKRNSVFNEACKSAKYAIYIKNEKADSIFFDPDGGVAISKLKNGKWYLSHVGVEGAPLLNGGFLKFYEKKETRLDSAGKKVRFYHGDYQGVEIEKFESSHAVLTETQKLGKNLSVEVYSIVIKNLNSNEVIAETKYVLDSINGRFCNGAERKGRFSTSEFIREALNL
jgi:hypothetical protein